MKSKMLALGIGVLLVTAAVPAAAQEASWIHIRVNEGDASKVSVNLPMSLVEVAMDIAQSEGFSGEHGIHFGTDHDVDLEDLRKMWAELRDAGDAEYVAVEEDDEQVRIWREGDKVLIRVSEEGRDKVNLQVPFSVVDILLQGEGDELNLVGAIREMANINDGEIIQVNDGETAVRIWIDKSNQD